MYDVIVVGARCAGSPTAMLLARKGYRVLLVDKTTFPSDTVSAHYIQQSGVVQLKRWGLLDKLVDSGCPPIQRATFNFFGSVVLTAWGLSVEGVAEGYGPRRTVIDKILVDAAVEAGVELREGFVLQEVCMDGDRVTGIRGRTSSRSTVTEKARIVIGSDGKNSLVARSVRAPEYNTIPSLGCYYYSYWSGVPMEGAELYTLDNRIVVACPTNDNLLSIFIGWPNREFHKVRTDIEGNFLATLDLIPELAERVRSGKREEPYYGTGHVPNFFRKPYGNGWALVGDAGCHKDPILAQGMKDAFLSAELLANAIDIGLSGRKPLNEALAEYERQRNEAIMPQYKRACERATFEPASPEAMRLLAALQGNQREIDRFWAVEAGTVPIQDFYSPENIQRIMGAAAVGVG
ncbi:MAG: NAD(P)/FAD-dependent oxidoreductase [Scytonema hyalinum WJT4-NPBG1]|jgi:flavin-dependent dehydrogenase|nr:NAD(P)/FAD-dependent oxidoreductase [Scytonema hyalinum WJT4-NPBG1]